LTALQALLAFFHEHINDPKAGRRRQARPPHTRRTQQRLDGSRGACDTGSGDPRPASAGENQSDTNIILDLELLDELSIEVNELSFDALFLAAKAFRKYRERSGTIRSS